MLNSNAGGGDLPKKRVIDGDDRYAVKNGIQNLGLTVDLVGQAIHQRDGPQPPIALNFCGWSDTPALDGWTDETCSILGEDELIPPARIDAVHRELETRARAVRRRVEKVRVRRP